MIRNKKQKGFTPISKFGAASRRGRERGFTLIELLVVIAIIALLSSIVLIALISARQKSRNAKRLGDMTQMNTALELYFAANRGYPSGTNGVPLDLKPEFITSFPKAPLPADGVCGLLTYGSPLPAGIPANTYYYYPSGTSYLGNGKMVFPDYAYYFCLGNKTGNFGPGIRIITSTGVK